MIRVLCFASVLLFAVSVRAQNPTAQQIAQAAETAYNVQKSQMDIAAYNVQYTCDFVQYELTLIDNEMEMMAYYGLNSLYVLDPYALTVEIDAIDVAHDANDNAVYDLMWHQMLAEIDMSNGNYGAAATRYVDLTSDAKDIYDACDILYCDAWVVKIDMDQLRIDWQEEVNDWWNNQ